MWGPLKQLRRWWRPQPVVGHVFRFRRIWHRGDWVNGDTRLLAHMPAPTGFVVDVAVRERDVDRALRRAIEYVAAHVDPKVELDDVRLADRFDFSAEVDVGQVGPRRHIGRWSPPSRRFR